MLPSARLLMLVAITCTALALGGTTPLPTQGCLNWTAAAPVTLEVDGLTPLLLDERCNGHLDGVQLTLYCGVNASVTLSGWVMEGGAVTVVGPKATPWTLMNVSVVVVNSRIHATLGPAVGVLAGAEFPGTGGPSITNLALSAYNSTMVSNGSAPVVLGIALAERCSGTLPLNNIAITAHRSLLVATAGVADIVAVVAGFAVSEYRYEIYVDGFTVSLIETNATAVVGVRGIPTAVMVGGIALGVTRKEAAVRGARIVVSGGILSAVSDCLGTPCAAAVGSIVIGQANLGATVADSTIDILRAFSTVVVTSAPQLSGCGIGSVVVAYTLSGTFYFENVSLSMQNSRSTSRCGTDRTAGSVAVGIAGFAYGAITGSFVFLRNLSTHVDSSFADAAGMAQYCGVAVGGIAAGKGYSGSLDLRGTSVSIAHSTTAGNTTSSDDAAASVGGIAIGYAQSFEVHLWNVTARLVVSRATATAVSSNAQGAAAVGGISAGAATPITIYGVLAEVNCTNATASCTAVQAGSTIGGVSVGNAAGTQYVADLVLEATGSTMLSSTLASQMSASTISGVAMAGDLYLTNLSTAVAWCNATSRTLLTATAASSAISGFAGMGSTIVVSMVSAQLLGSRASSEGYNGASAVAGVAANAAASQANSVQLWVEGSNATSTAVLVGGGAAATSAVGGVSGDTQLNDGTILVYGRSALSACATAPPASTACGKVHKSSSTAKICCTTSNTSFTALLDPARMPSCSEGGAGDSTDRRSHTRSLRRRTATHTPHSTTRQSLSATGSSAPTQTLAVAKPLPSHTVAKNSTAAPSTAVPGTTDAPRPNATTAASSVAPTTLSPNGTAVLPPKSVPPTPSRGDRLGVDTTGAQAVIVSAYGSSAIAGALSPTAANKPVATGRIVDSVKCDLDGDSTDPNSWTLMPGVVGDASSPASMVVSTVALMALVLALAVFCSLYVGPRR